MSDEVETPDTESTDPAPEEGAQGGEQTPPWGTTEEFDAEKAWNLIQGLRSDKDKLSIRATTAEGRVKKFEDAKLSTEEKTARDLKDQQAAYAEMASENALLKAGIEHGLTADDLDLLRGLPADAIADRAAKLAARLGAGTPPKPLTARPREALKGGADPTVPATGGDWLRDAMAGTD
jgi:hypothetical protein